MSGSVTLNYAGPPVILGDPPDQNELHDFRCPICRKLQCRVSPDSIVERKCKCKALIVYDKGEVRVLSPKEG